MSYAIETLNRGTVEDFGFVWGDTESIRMGALPAMPINEFARYSTDTILGIFQDESVDAELKQRLLLDIAFNCGRVIQAEAQELNLEHGFRRIQHAEFRGVREGVKQASKVFAEIDANLSRSYKRNPFVFSEGKVTVSNFYELDVPQFVLFAARVLGGGLAGWNPELDKIPSSVSESVRRLMDELKI